MSAPAAPAAPDADELRDRTRALLAAHPPASTPRADFLRARFDAGLAWVHYPAGLGGLDAPRSLQSVVDAGLRLDVGKQYLSAIPPMSEEGERCGRRY